MYSSTNRISSNFARDKKMNKEKDLFCLGQEPPVDVGKTFTVEKINVGSLTSPTKIKQNVKNNSILIKQRKCPDESLYEDLVENIRVQSENHSVDIFNDERCTDSESQDLNESKPFRRFESCLFSCFTSCLPWCLMRRIYWNKK